MKINTWIMVSLVITILGIALSIHFFFWPTAQHYYRDMKADETRVAYRDNYKLHTTPLPSSVLKDICEKLEIETTSGNCKSDKDVYGPDLFDEIIEYFGSLPESEKTYDLVQEKLGTYLVLCEEPSSDGGYVCEYDLRGDSRYPIAFFFDNKGFYYRIIANTGGS